MTVISKQTEDKAMAVISEMDMVIRGQGRAGRVMDQLGYPGAVEKRKSWWCWVEDPAGKQQN